MIKGARTLTVAGCVAAAACAQTQSVKVRAIADPAQKERSGGGLLADARAQLALGDVGLALETFQTLARQQPENPDAYAGIAACYEAMGRFDIARQNYELALAFAPNDPALLLDLAGSLDHLGVTDQASQVRAEAARLRMPPMAVTPPTVKQLSSVTVKLPEPSVVTPAKAPPAADIASAVPAMKTTAPADGPHDLASTAAPPSTADKQRLARSAPMEVARAVSPSGRAAASTATVSSASYAPKAPGSEKDTKIAISLPIGELLTNPSPALSATPRAKSVSPPAARTVQMALRAPNKASPLTIAPTRPADRDRLPLAAVAQVDSRVESGPRVQRVSQSEVSLITVPQPVRYAQLARPPVRSEVAINPRPALSTPQLASTLRWVPLKYASATDNIQLLNAARSRSLAAHVRMSLLNRGWRKIGIGNARLVREHSLVLYSPARAAIARRLAAQFHCKALQTRGIKSVLVLLGRDAALTRRAIERA